MAQATRGTAGRRMQTESLSYCRHKERRASIHLSDPTTLSMLPLDLMSPHISTKTSNPLTHILAIFLFGSGAEFVRFAPNGTTRHVYACPYSIIDSHPRPTDTLQPNWQTLVTDSIQPNWRVSVQSQTFFYLILKQLR